MKQYLPSSEPEKAEPIWPIFFLMLTGAIIFFALGFVVGKAY